MKFFASSTLRPLSITIVNPELRGFIFLSGICDKLKFIIFILIQKRVGWPQK